MRSFRSAVPVAVCLAFALSFALASARADDGKPPPSPPTAPTRPQESAEKPKIAFSEETHDFGVAKQEALLRAEITIRNDGKANLHLTDVRADCGCSTATTGTRDLAPGATTPLAITVRTFTMSGPMTKRIRVASNDPDRPIAELHFTVDIAAGIVLDPPRFYFGNVLAGTAPSASMCLKWKDGLGKAFRVKSVEAPGADLAFETKPFEAPPWHGWTITGTFKKPPPIGTVSANALVRLDDPDSPTVAASITAFVSGKVWVDQRAVSVGLVPYGKGRVLSIIARGITSETDLKAVTAKSRGGRVHVQVAQGGIVPGPGGGQREWIVSITLPENAEPGRVEDVVEVSSAIPGEPPAEVKVTGQVLDKQK